MDIGFVKYLLEAAQALAVKAPILHAPYNRRWQFSKRCQSRFDRLQGFPRGVLPRQWNVFDKACDCHAIVPVVIRCQQSLGHRLWQLLPFGDRHFDCRARKRIQLSHRPIAQQRRAAESDSKGNVRRWEGARVENEKTAKAPAEAYGRTESESRHPSRAQPS